MFHLDIKKTDNGWVANAHGLGTQAGCWDAEAVPVFEKVEIDVPEQCWNHGPFARLECTGGTAQICEGCERYIIEQSPGSDDVTIIVYQAIGVLTHTVLSPTCIRVLLNEDVVEWWQENPSHASKKKEDTALQRVWDSIYPINPWRKVFHDLSGH